MNRDNLAHRLTPLLFIFGMLTLVLTLPLNSDQKSKCEDNMSHIRALTPLAWAESKQQGDSRSPVVSFINN